MSNALPRLAALLSAGLLLGGCPIGNERYTKPRDLSEAWFIDKLRLLAIQAEPPEVVPGETATFTALVVDPNEEAGLTAWIACPIEGDGGFGCELDPTLDFEDATFDELQEAGVIGFEPGLTPRYTAPADFLDDLPDEDRAEGGYVLAQAFVLPADVLGEEGPEDFDFNQVEAGYKRLVISEAPTPNRNPGISHWVVDGARVPAGSVVEVDPGQIYQVAVELSDNSLERYVFLRDGQEEERIEEPYFKWYTDGGTQLEDATLYPFTEADWQSPDADDPVQEGTWWVVVRDRRGGMTWAAQGWRVR